jgi:hypothetical protein
MSRQADASGLKAKAAVEIRFASSPQHARSARMISLLKHEVSPKKWIRFFARLTLALCISRN